MRDGQEQQDELEVAQPDLEAIVAELRTIFLEVEPPRGVIDTTRDVVTWLGRHMWRIVGTATLRAAIRLRHVRLHRSAPSHSAID